MTDPWRAGALEADKLARQAHTSAPRRHRLRAGDAEPDHAISAQKGVPASSATDADVAAQGNRS